MFSVFSHIKTFLWNKETSENDVSGVSVNEEHPTEIEQDKAQDKAQEKCVNVEEKSEHIAVVDTEEKSVETEEKSVETEEKSVDVQDKPEEIEEEGKVEVVPTKVQCSYGITGISGPTGKSMVDVSLSV